MPAAATTSQRRRRTGSRALPLIRNPAQVRPPKTTEKREMALGFTRKRTSADASAFDQPVSRDFSGRRSATTADSLTRLLVPLADRLDLVIVPHERDDVAHCMSDQRLGHVGLV